MRKKISPTGFRRRPLKNDTPLRAYSSTDTTKTHIAVVTSCLISLAVTFDVGFFKGIDVDMFTFFTLGEHTLFALESIPYLLLFAMVVLAGYITLRAFYKLVVEKQRGRDEYGKVEPLDWYLLFSLFSLVTLGY